MKLSFHVLPVGQKEQLNCSILLDASVMEQWKVNGWFFIQGHHANEHALKI